MSGRDAQRGFIFQSIIAMIECLERDDWDEVKLEPDTANDKVDIQLYKDGTVLSAIQVKSSRNQFKRYNVSNWLEELKKDALDAKEVRLYLVGDLFSESCKDYIRQNSNMITIVPYANLNEICTGKLTKYIRNEGLGKNVRVDDLERIDASLFSRIHKNSISKDRLTRITFRKDFQQALPLQDMPKCLTTYLPVGPEIGLIGRDSIVDELLNLLLNTGCIVLVSGLGGIGKTAVMQKVCETISNDGIDENHVAWITCGESLEDDLLILRDSLGIPSDYERNQAFNAILKELQHLEGNLYLFLDDMRRLPSKEEMGILNALRSKVRIMMTSRHEIKGILQKELVILDQEPLVDMFYGYYERDRERAYKEDVWRIINSLSVNRHTLLVELLAKAAKSFIGTLDQFRLKLEKKGFFNVSAVRLDTRHDENLTIEESIIRLYNISNLSAKQKRIMGLFTIFTPEKEIYGECIEWANLDENEVNSLLKLGWLVREDEGFLIRQIVRDSLARQVGSNIKLEEYGDLLERVADIDDYIPPESEYTKIMERLVIAEDVARYLEYRTEGMLEFDKYHENEMVLLLERTELLNNLAVIYINQGDYRKASNYCGKAVEIREKVLGPDHVVTAVAYNTNLRIKQAQGDYVEALSYGRKAIAIAKRKDGNNLSNLAILYNDIASVYHAIGNYEKALRHYKKSRNISEKVFGTEHQNTAVIYSNMAETYHAIGDFEKAEEYYTKAVAIIKKIFGEYHQDLAIVYSNMANMYREICDNKKAMEYCLNAISICEKVLGSEHPYTAMMYDNLSAIYLGQGDYELALKYCEKALNVFKNVFGIEHPDTARSLDNMAGIYRALGNTEMALRYCEKALSINEKVLGVEHPDTATTYNNVAGLYSIQGNYKKALEYGKKALHIRERLFGRMHPNVANVHNTIAGIYFVQGEKRKALSHCKKAFSIFKKTQGEDHPDTQEAKTAIQIIESLL